MLSYICPPGYHHYAHLASVKFEHSVCRGSLMTTYIYTYIYAYIYIYIYIYSYCTYCTYCTYAYCSCFSIKRQYNTQ